MKRTISIKGRSDNLHFIRFAAAIGVMICHCFSITQGQIDGEWLYSLTDGQLNFGLVSVAIFFLAGGLFIARSAERERKAGPFFKARALRIFPPLIFVTIAVIFLGVFFSDLSAPGYFLNGQTWLYLLNGIFIPVHTLPGVFSENPFLPTVNGSLWTLPIEFACYVACFLMVKWKMTTKKGYTLTIPAALVGLAVTRVIGIRYPFIENIIFPCFFFYIGMGYWVFHEQIVLKGVYAAGALALIAVSCLIGQGKIGLLFGLPYILFFITFAQIQLPGQAGDLGEYSYGMYLWGFPVQQAVQSIMKNTGTPVKNLLFAVPVVIVLGAVTFYVVEKPIMRMQKARRKTGGKR